MKYLEPTMYIMGIIGLSIINYIAHII